MMPMRRQKKAYQVVLLLVREGTFLTYYYASHSIKLHAASSWCIVITYWAVSRSIRVACRNLLQQLLPAPNSPLAVTSIAFYDHVATTEIAAVVIAVVSNSHITHPSVKLNHDQLAARTCQRSKISGPLRIPISLERIIPMNWLDASETTHFPNLWRSTLLLNFLSTSSVVRVNIDFISILECRIKVFSQNNHAGCNKGFTSAKRYSQLKRLISMWRHESIWKIWGIWSRRYDGNE